MLRLRICAVKKSMNANPARSPPAGDERRHERRLADDRRQIFFLLTRCWRPVSAVANLPCRPLPLACIYCIIKDFMMHDYGRQGGGENRARQRTRRGRRAPGQVSKCPQ